MTGQLIIYIVKKFSEQLMNILFQDFVDFGPNSTILYLTFL